MKINPERLAYWYLRFNGFLTTTNFVVHPEVGRDQRTDVDVLGVRFPHRAELLNDPMEDDPVLIGKWATPLVVIAEVKTAQCALNGPWRNPDAQNMHRILSAIGIVPRALIENAAAALYQKGVYLTQDCTLSLLCFGKEQNPRVAARFPAVLQITWENVLRFIYCRFMKYEDQKIAHPQWDADGKDLWEAATFSRNLEAFSSSVEIQV
jgi:hypothetical protein